MDVVGNGVSGWVKDLVRYYWAGGGSCVCCYDHAAIEHAADDGCTCACSFR